MSLAGMWGPVGAECAGPGPGCGPYLVFYLLSFPPAARPTSARSQAEEKVALITALALQGVVLIWGGPSLLASAAHLQREACTIWGPWWPVWMHSPGGLHVDPGLTIEDTVLPLKSLPLGSSCPYSSEHQVWSASWVKVEGLPLPQRTLPAPRFLDSLTLRFCISNILSISDFTGLWFLVLLPQNLQPPSTVFKPQGENSAFWQIDIFRLTLLYSLLPGPEEVAVAGQGGQR